MVNIRALDFALFFVLLNGSFFMFETLGIWAGGPVGMEVENIAEAGISVPGAPMPSILGSLTLWGIVGAVIAGGVTVTILGRATTPQVVGVAAFSFIFWTTFGSTVGIMSQLQIPLAFTGLFTALGGIVFVLAVIQMATGVSFKLTE